MDWLIAAYNVPISLNGLLLIMQYLVLCLNGNDDRLLFQVPSMPLSQHNGDKKDNHIKNFAFIYRDDDWYFVSTYNLPLNYSITDSVIVSYSTIFSLHKRSVISFRISMRAIRYSSCSCEILKSLL